VERTADPSASLGMTKGRATLPWRAVARLKLFFISLGGPQTAGPCPLGMRKGSGTLPFVFDAGRINRRSLRFAPVGMTIHILVRDASAQEKLSYSAVPAGLARLLMLTQDCVLGYFHAVLRTAERSSDFSPRVRARNPHWSGFEITVVSKRSRGVVFLGRVIAS
jgi:hypothetical protein